MCKLDPLSLRRVEKGREGVEMALIILGWLNFAVDILIQDHVDGQGPYRPSDRRIGSAT